MVNYKSNIDRRNIIIARELVDIARELVASDYKHKKDYTDADEEERYAMELAETVREHFKEGRLESPIVDYTIKVSPKRYLKRNAKTPAQKKSYEVRVILMYVDKVKPSDLPCDEARETYQDGNGIGQAHTYDLDNLVVVCNGSSDDDYCDENYFISTLVHELMHILDACAYNYFFTYSENFGKRTKHEMKRNLWVPYPIGNADVLDEKYAEYYTCEAEMREYRYNLRYEISQWCERMDIEWNEAIDEIRKAMSDEKSFRRFIENWYGNVSPFATLYHLCFSRTSHGNRQTALKLLNGLQPLE